MYLQGSEKGPLIGILSSRQRVSDQRGIWSMKIVRHLMRLVILLAVASLVHAENPALPHLNVVPLPVKIKPLPGTFTLDNQTRIVAVDEESRRIATLLNDFLLSNHGFHLKIQTAAPKVGRYISFTQAGGRDLPAEGYRLLVMPAEIRVVGQPAGLFYGMETLTQLLPLGLTPSVLLPAVDITDYPRFHYRGVLLDVGRHFFSVTFLKNYLDQMAQYKINKFHWHLTDDQGWRIEIKKYPRLTEIGPQRKDLSEEENLDPYARGYYTQEQIKEIVAYAQARFITVIPEIEMPGHSGAALAAYPELGCTPAPSAVSSGATVPNDVFCPKEETFSFLQNVLSEVITLFPGPFVHIGGDEVSKDSWKRSADAQAVMRREGLKDENELETYFVQRMEKFLRSKGRRTIGWDEILEGGLAPNAIVMSWRGEGGGIAAAKQKHEVIMSPTDYCYFDYNQGDARREPPSIGGFIPLEKVYGYDPIPGELTSDEQKYILGAQANLWTEYISAPQHLEYMTFPRLLALSEVAWSALESKDYANFQQRLPYHLSRLEKQDLNYRIPEPVGLKDFYTAADDHVRIQLSSLIPGSQVYYTLDGSTPTDQSPRYQMPFQVPLPPDQKTLLNLIVVTPRGRRSIVYTATLLRRSYRDAIPYTESRPGMTFTLFDGKFASTQDIDLGTQATSGIATSFDLQQFGRPLNYGVTFDGYLKVPADGFYKFAVESDDGTVLWIDGEEVVNNDGNHASQLATGYVPLRQGFHKMQLKYFQGEGGAALAVGWAISGQELKPLDGSGLYH
jgi:hexosaminidase